MFSLGLLLRAAVGACSVAISNRFRVGEQFAFVLPFAILLLIAMVPAYYYYIRPFSAGRGLLNSYRRLEPFHELLEKPNAGFVSLGWPSELCNYLGKSGSCRPLPFSALRDEVLAGNPWNVVLGRNNATLVYADETVLADPLGRQFVDTAAQFGWRTIAAARATARNWRLLAFPGKTDIVPADASVRLGKGWYDFEKFADRDFRWVNNDAEFYVRRRTAGPVFLAISLEDGPSLDGRPLVLQVFANGKAISTVSRAPSGTLELRLPKDDCEDDTLVRLHVNGSPEKTFPGESRVLNFRVFDIAAK